MELSNDNIEEIQKTLDFFYKLLRQRSKHTIASLGSKDALHIVDFHSNNWIEILKWINLEYKNESENSVLFFFFTLLFKEIYWLQLIFLYTNYPIVYRNLRYLWELITLGYYIEEKFPNISLDEGMDMALKIEENGTFGWRLIITSFPSILEKSIEEVKNELHPLWKYLCKHAHPSGMVFHEIAEKDFSALITDSFNDELSQALLSKLDIVFDLIYACIFKRFPKILRLAANYEFLVEWKNLIPITFNIIEKSHVPGF